LRIARFSEVVAPKSAAVPKSEAVPKLAAALETESTLLRAQVPTLFSTQESISKTQQFYKSINTQLEQQRTLRVSQCLTQWAFHWTFVCHAPPGPGSSLTLTTLHPSSHTIRYRTPNTYLDSGWISSQSPAVTNTNTTAEIFIFRQEPCMAPHEVRTYQWKYYRPG
jgi:hypothetical protein